MDGMRVQRSLSLAHGHRLPLLRFSV